MREGGNLEFKQAMYQRKDPAAVKELLRDVNSMANANGGALVIGVEEDGEGTALRLFVRCPTLKLKRLGS